MSNLIRRDNSIARVLGSHLAPAGAYTVTVYRPGAEVSASSAGASATVYSGHGFQIGDKLCLFTEGEAVDGTLRTVEAVAATSLTLDTNLDLAVGDILVNLGDDSGGSTVNFDGSPVQIFNDMSGSGGAIEGSTLTTTSRGDYGYYYSGPVWELVYSGLTMKGLHRVVNPSSDTTVFAHLFATGGAGTESDPWTFEGSNPVQAALDSIAATGGHVKAVRGFYDLGAANVAVDIPVTVDAADKLAFTISGDGDLTVFNYRGTGTAIGYFQTYTSEGPGNSVQSNQVVLEDFQVRQTANPRTGTGIWLNYTSRWRITNVSVGTPRWNRASGDEGFEYGLQLNQASTGVHTIDDYLTVAGCRFSGNTHAMYASELANNLRVLNSYFESNPNVSAPQDGIAIHNSNGGLFSGNAFNFFNSTGSFAIKFSTDISGMKVTGNYFYGNLNGVYLYADGDQDGIDVSGNYFSLSGVSGGVGVRAGIDTVYDSNGDKVRGLVVQDNTFDLLQTDDIGVYCGADVENGFLIGNWYNVTSGTRTSFVAGSQVMVMEAVDGTDAAPQLQINHYGSYLGGILLNNSNPAAGVSPRITFKAGAGGLRFGLQAGQSGELNVTDDAGVVIFTISQAGVVTPVSFMDRKTTAGITAVAAGAQYTGALTAEVNEVSVCATNNDCVTLPAAAAGRTCIIINNGLAVLKIWAASGDLVAGASSTTLGAGANGRYVAYNATNWEIV